MVLEANMKRMLVVAFAAALIVATASPAFAGGASWNPDGAAAPSEGWFDLLAWWESLFAGWIINPDG